MPENISDMRNYIQSRQRKEKTPTEIREDLMKAGYDFHAASALILKYWERKDFS